MTPIEPKWFTKSKYYKPPSERGGGGGGGNNRWRKFKDKIKYRLRKTGACIPGGKGSTDCATFM